MFVDHVFLQSATSTDDTTNPPNDINSTDDDDEIQSDDECEHDDDTPRRAISARHVGDASFDSDAHSDVDVHHPAVSAPRLHTAMLQQGVQSSNHVRLQHLEPVGTAVYPQHLSNDAWPASYEISDHRPVAVFFRCTHVS